MIYFWVEAATRLLLLAGGGGHIGGLVLGTLLTSTPELAISTALSDDGCHGTFLLFLGDGTSLQHKS